ncbi:hypothetical protein [Streptomyces sp. IBSBF 2435]|uniref:hypothetical protein n=1 Tax=Streptomyces sp. IBSBF 2435 TaxID=2903531 RepID=UPI002FDBDCF3
MMRSTKRTLAGAFAAALLGAGGLLAAAPAGATANTANCSAVNTAPFYSSPGGGDSTWVYSVAPGGGISDTGNVALVNGTWYHLGHGNGHSDAWFRQADTTC